MTIPTRTVTVFRTTKNTSQEWTLETPVDLDARAWAAADPAGFDEHLHDFGRRVDDDTNNAAVPTFLVVENS